MGKLRVFMLCSAPIIFRGALEGERPQSGLLRGCLVASGILVIKKEPVKHAAAVRRRATCGIFRESRPRRSERCCPMAISRTAVELCQ